MVLRTFIQFPQMPFFSGFALCLLGLTLASRADAQALPRFPETATPQSAITSSTTPQSVAMAGATTSTRSATTDTSYSRLVSFSNDFSGNASLDERMVVAEQVGSIANLLAIRDDKALEVFALDIAPATTQLRATATISRLATSLRGALVQVQFSFTPVAKPLAPGRKPTSTPGKTISSRFDFSYDIWFARVPDGSFALSSAWLLPADAATQLQSDSLRLWNETLATQPTRATHKVAPHPNINRATSTTVSALITPNVALNRGGDILTLVAEYRGGRWVALRANAPWQGAILDSANLARAASRMQAAATAVIRDEKSASTANPVSNAALTLAAPTLAASSDASSTREVRGLSSTSNLSNGSRGSVALSAVNLATANPNQWIRPWLISQMNRYSRRAAGTAHFVFQRSARGWIGIDSVFESAREASDASYARADENARQLRSSLESDFGVPQAHLNYALALSSVSLFNEAADELAKAAAMQPDLVKKTQTHDFETARSDDAQSRVDAQRDIAKRTGYSTDHPLKRLPLYQNNFRARPNSLLALRIALEYSRLAYEREAITWYDYAMSGAASFVATANHSDYAWFNVLRGQTKTRFDLAMGKPNNIIRSDLFTVRCTLNDLNIVQLLSGLEAAQYTIYSRFGVPMGNTEVILWSSQELFQDYTSRQAGRRTSEFVTALTLTQLVNADVGPVVLSEEINFYADPRADSISTIAHEYGHIAVRNLAKGRMVPDWFNEGIATYVEGGYENYLSRVRNARQRGALLSMREMQNWNVDGERAFLAYSQANSMIDFIVEQKNWGGQAILDILKKIGEDVPPDDAIKSILRVTPNQLHTLWTRRLAEQDAARKKAATSTR